MPANQVKINDAAMDEMWPFVHNNSKQYWLWWVVDHNTGVPLAYCFGTMKHKYLDKLWALLKSFKINTIYYNHNFRL